MCMSLRSSNKDVIYILNTATVFWVCFCNSLHRSLVLESCRKSTFIILINKTGIFSDNVDEEGGEISNGSNGTNIWEQSKDHSNISNGSS